MRVEAYNKIGQIYQTEQKARAKEATKAASRDELTISSAGKDYQTARQALAAIPDIRMDRVADLKAGIESGTYQVNADSFAAKVIAKYEEMSL